EPAGPRLGPDAVTEADVVLLPGLAVDARGMRLGRGGGSYDRVLARLERGGADPALVVLLYDGEVVARVPEEPHDRPVRAAGTPGGVRRFGGGRAGPGRARPSQAEPGRARPSRAEPGRARPSWAGPGRAGQRRPGRGTGR